MLKLISALLSLLCLTLPLGAEPLREYTENRVHNKLIEQRWAEWVKRTQQHEQILREAEHPKLVHWRKQLTVISLADELEGLRQLNRLINSDVDYIDDYSHYHLKDYWADPVTTLEEGGDCEDIALLKATTLRYLGWPKERMHLLVGFLTERGRAESHAVLLVETNDNRQHILRSIGDDVVEPAHFRFTPIYAVDGSGTLIVKSVDN
jgi:predicted transglutaminase-like cysteine proteinase